MQVCHWGLTYSLDSAKKEEDAAMWRDLIDNSEQWWDYRDSKLDRLVTLPPPLWFLTFFFFSFLFSSVILFYYLFIFYVLCCLLLLLSKQVNPNYPDFKHKDGNYSLWLSSAPQWVSSQLKGLKFDVKIKIQKSNEGKASRGRGKSS